MSQDLKPVRFDQVRTVESPDDPGMETLCQVLAGLAVDLKSAGDWPRESLACCGKAGVFRWFVPLELGGLGWSQTEIARGYLKLGAACLTTTFVITQWVAAVKRLMASDNIALRDRLLPELLDGSSHITVGISHLTTSRRHLGRPALQATEEGEGFRLSGFSPWVTAAPFSKYILTGAQLASGQQILAVVATDESGVQVEPSQSLMALSASRTGSVRFDNVVVESSQMVAGPVEQVLTTLGSSNTGGFQTSTLALSLASAAIEFVEQQAEKREELSGNASELRQQWNEIVDDVMQLAIGHVVCSNEDLRTRSNSLVLRATQSAMIAAKGTGFVSGHPVERWCRQAMFFLVWSCPQSVQDANLCELAGIH